MNEMRFRALNAAEESSLELENIHQNRLCRTSRCGDAPELTEALGHSRIAHNIVNKLVQQGITQATDVYLMSDRDLLDIHGIGHLTIERLRAALPAPDSN